MYERSKGTDFSLVKVSREITRKTTRNAVCELLIIKKEHVNSNLADYFLILSAILATKLTENSAVICLFAACPPFLPIHNGGKNCEIAYVPQQSMMTIHYHKPGSPMKRGDLFSNSFVMSD